jgi:nucleoside-diphosphate-sugar epimerase
MISWVTENLGTGSYEKVFPNGAVTIVDVRELVDKGGNLPAAVEQKINAGVEYLKSGEKVVVCCDYGMSRSNAIAAGILAKVLGVPFDQALRQVMDATGQRAVKIEVADAVRAMLEGNQTAQPKAGSNSKRILVTGASGFIGSALVPALSRRHFVATPSRAELKLTEGASDLHMMVKHGAIDLVIHLANPRIYATNSALGETLTLLKNVLDVCKVNRIRLLYPSGWEVYSGYRAQSLMASEALAPLPSGPYGETKYLCEKLIDLHARQYGLEHLVLRTSPVYGEGSHGPRFIYNFLDKALRGREIVTHRYLNGFPHLDLIHIGDVVRAILACIEADCTGYLNLGTGRGISTAEVARLIVGLVNSNSEISHLQIDEFAPNVLIDASRAKATLGWAPSMEFSDGLRRIIDHVKGVVRNQDIRDEAASE